MYRFLILLSVIAIALAGGAKTITASVKDTQVNGVEGLNIKWSAPFKFQDWVVGFKTTLGDFSKAPEEFFAKKSFDAGDGTATVDAEYTVDSKKLAVNGKWVGKSGLELRAKGNTVEHLTEVAAETSTTVSGHKLNVGAVYDMLSKKLSTSTKLSVDDTDVTLAYDNADKDPVLEVSHKLDDKNTVSPTVSLKSGAMTYGWKRRIAGGTVDTKLHPGDKVEVTWEDSGASGVWTTKAEVPLDNHAGTKVGLSSRQPVPYISPLCSLLTPPTRTSPHAAGLLLARLDLLNSARGGERVCHQIE